MSMWNHSPGLQPALLSCGIGMSLSGSGGFSDSVTVLFVIAHLVALVQRHVAHLNIGCGLSLGIPSKFWCSSDIVFCPGCPIHAWNSS